MDNQLSQVDHRLEFLGTFVQKTLKLKPEKWSRMMATEENKSVVVKFLERPSPVLLVIVLTHTAQLIASNGFPLVQLKTKGVYFIKKEMTPVIKSSPSECIITGDLSAKVIDQLASLVDEILVPLISNATKCKQWPVVVSKDIHKHIHSLKSTVYQVKGQVNGHTVLPMPVGVEKIFDVEKTLVQSNGEVCDLYLKSAIEGIIIKWSAQISDVLANDSTEKGIFNSNPVPSVEIQFWNLRLRNLNHIYTQLRDLRVKSMAIVLEKTNSAYCSCFKDIFKNTVIALAEAKSICLYLTPLKKHIQLIEETDFSECTPLLAPIMHVICLIWYNCKPFDQGKLITIMKQICNLLILKAKQVLDPTTLFHSDIEEAMQRVKLCIKVLKHFKHIFNTYKNNLERFYDGKSPNNWNFHPIIVFGRLISFLERLETIQWFFNTVLEFSKLQKVEISGLKGRLLSVRITHVFEEFQQCFLAFSGKSYDVLDPDDSSFVVEFEHFKQKVLEMDIKLSAVLCQSFEDCAHLENIFKLIDIAGSVIERPVIKLQFTNQFEKIVDMLETELKICQFLFENYVQEGRKIGQFPVDKFMPPLAGTLRWTSNLNARLNGPLENFKSLQHPVTRSPRANSILRKIDTFSKSIGEFNKDMFAEWVAAVPAQITLNLNQNILRRRPNSKELYVNFNPQLEAILREAHYFNLMEKKNLPDMVVEFAKNNERLRQLTTHLNVIVSWYNKIKKSSKVEFDLIDEDLSEIDKLILIGQNNLNWNSAGKSFMYTICMFNVLLHFRGLKVFIKLKFINYNNYR